MRLQEAQEIIRELDGKSYSYLEQWGLSLAREAVRTIGYRKTATQEDRLIAERIRLTIFWTYLS